MSNITLYQCTEDVRLALDQLADNDEQWAQDTLEAVIGQFEHKAHSVAAYILNSEAQADLLDAHIKAMQAKLKTARARAEKLREYLKHNMLAAGIREIKANDGTFKASFRKSEAVEIFDESQLPPEVMTEKITYTASKTAIKAAIAAGQDIPGAKLVTRENLQIK